MQRIRTALGVSRSGYYANRHKPDGARRQQIARLFFDYNETIYNPRRRHSSLGYISPAQFEQQTRSRALF